MSFASTISALFGNVGVMFMFAYLAKGSKTLNSTGTTRKILLRGILGGVIAIYASLAAVTLAGFDNILINVRDTAAIAAGMTGGPVAGIIAGLLGGGFRLLLGGETVYACAIATLLAGVIGGVLPLVLKTNLFKASWGIIIGAVMELIHMALILLLVKPFSSALAITGGLVIPMVLFNAIALALVLHLFGKKE